MKKVLLFLITSLSLLGQESSDYLKNFSVDLRSTYLNYSYDKAFSDAEAFSVSLKIKYEQEILKGLRVGVAFGTVQDLGLLNDDVTKRYMSYMFDKDYESYTLLHQAYLCYTHSQSFIEVGYFELETPLISSDDYFALSNTFEGIHFEIGELQNHKFRVGYISKMAGAWDGAYDGATYNSMTKQAWAHSSVTTPNGDNVTEVYYNIVDDLGVKEAGMAFVGVEFDNDTFKAQIYDHMMMDAYNSLFFQLDYRFKIGTNDALIAGQYVKYDAIGALKNHTNPDVNIDYSTQSAKFTLNVDRLALNVAYTGISDTKSIYLFGTAGGYPEFAGGMMIGYFSTILRDANIYSLKPAFSFGSEKHSFDLSLVYAYFDLNAEYTKNCFVGDRVEGENYMHAYGIGVQYTYDKKISWMMKTAQRRLESGDKSLLFRTIARYAF